MAAGLVPSDASVFPSLWMAVPKEVGPNSSLKTHLQRQMNSEVLGV